MKSAITFLERFRVGDREDATISVFADDPDGFGAALETMPDALGEAFSAAVSDQHGAPVVLHEDCFASAAVDRHGTLVVAGERFGGWFDNMDPFSMAVRNIQADQPRVAMFADDRSGRPVALAAGTIASARQWPLDTAVREALTTSAASFAIIAFRPGPLSWTLAARAYGLTPAESGLVAALARSGDLQRAAREQNIAYETARKYVASAMEKTGSKRQTDLIRSTLMIAAGDIADAQNLAALAADLFTLTERQANLAVLIANGATRERAAEILVISEHRAKADLKIVFQALGVMSAADLSRVMTEISALRGLATACEVTVESVALDDQPLRLIQRSWAAGRIAIADHGPPRAIPVLIFHSNISGRHHPRSFISKLQAAGYRPIAIERAGYGLSDTVAGDPVDTGVRDVHDVLDALGLPTAIAIARCTTASVIACAAEREGRITGGVLLWPDPPPREDRSALRMSQRARSIFVRHHDLALPFVRMLCRRMSAGASEKLWRSAVKGVAVDEALLDDPAERADLLRGCQQAVRGMHGFLNEAIALGAGANPVQMKDGSRWSAIFGSGYEKFDVADAAHFWGAAMPGATIDIVREGVHFLHVTHTDAVISALHRSTQGASPGPSDQQQYRAAHETAAGQEIGLLAGTAKVGHIHQ